MIVFLLSACPNFNKGYAAIIHEYIQGTIPVYFDSYHSLIAHSGMRPDLIMLKEEGMLNLRQVVEDMLNDFPYAIVGVAHWPGRGVLADERLSDRLYYFPLNEPEDVTLNHLMAKMIVQGVDFEANEDPTLGEAYDLFKKYLLLNANLAICMSYIHLGDSATQIGQKMHLSPRTIEDYISRLKTVFGCHSKKELVYIYDRISNLSSSIANDQLVRKEK
jgi:DNA-binding CsgD family transcriptional regulator